MHGQERGRRSAESLGRSDSVSSGLTQDQCNHAISLTVYMLPLLLKCPPATEEIALVQV